MSRYFYINTPQLTIDIILAQCNYICVKYYSKLGNFRIMQKAHLTIGQYYKGEGVYVGTYEPVDRNGQYLGKVFNLFAAREDIDGSATYNDTVKKVKEIKALEGHNGAQFENDSGLYKVLESKNYDGEWFIPSLDMLKANNSIKRDNDLVAMAGGSLYDLKEKGGLKSTFTTMNNGNDYVHQYWSCTESKGDNSFVRFMDFSFGVDIVDPKGFRKLSCRLVRAVPVDLNELFFPALRRPLKVGGIVKL